MKTEVLISFAKLICVFVFAYEKRRVSYDESHLFRTVEGYPNFLIGAAASLNPYNPLLAYEICLTNNKEIFIIENNFKKLLT